MYCKLKLCIVSTLTFKVFFLILFLISGLGISFAKKISTIEIQNLQIAKEFFQFNLTEKHSYFYKIPISNLAIEHESIMSFNNKNILRREIQLKVKSDLKSLCELSCNTTKYSSSQNQIYFTTHNISKYKFLKAIYNQPIKKQSI
jgi:hypothetical protein